MHIVWKKNPLHSDSQGPHVHDHNDCCFSDATHNVLCFCAMIFGLPLEIHYLQESEFIVKLVFYLANFLCILRFAGTPCFRGHGRRNGERRRKSVRGCIVSPDLSVLNLVIVKKGDNDLPGLTDVEKPRMRGPKRASKIRKLFNLSKDDDVRKYVNTYRRTFTTKDGKFLIPRISYPFLYISLY